MKIFAIGSAVPYRPHNQADVTAVNIVLYELLRSLRHLGHEIVLQMLFNQYRSTTSLSPAEENELLHLRELGIRVLPPIYPEQYLIPVGPVSRLRRLGSLISRLFVWARIEDFYPAINCRHIISERVRSSKVDALLTIWSPEGVAATHELHEIPRIAYQGDIDFAPVEVRVRDHALFSGTWSIRQELMMLLRRLELIQFKRVHLRLMRNVPIIASVTASNADFYRRHGHPRSIYHQNTWSDPGAERLDLERPDPRSSSRTIKIIGHIGYLNRTGSTYGLKFLLVDLLPVLEEVMDSLDYRIHIIGGGEAVPSLQPRLRHDHIVVRGFVEDLDAELRSSDMVLLLNNAGPYQAAFTRHIVVWSMSLCLIVHANSKKAIPEIVHMENALVGATPFEIAQMIYLAATDRDLNRRIRQGGRSTYEKYFTPHVVAEALSKEISSLVRPGAA